jgi:hypothetical protein
MSVVLAYKNFAANRNISHIGLGVAAINTAKVLRREGIRAQVWPIMNPTDLRTRLQTTAAKHVVISAPWIPGQDLQSLATDFPETHFTVNCHSNVGFLQADYQGVKLMRETMDIELGMPNVHLAGNSRRFCDWIRAAFGTPCLYLPNLYWLHSEPVYRYQPFSGGTLRIGVFGAARPLKNLMSAAAAALELSRNLRAPLELWLSSGRTEGAGEGILSAVREMLAGIPNVKLVLNGWQSWPGFRKTVAHMYLLLQPSYTESFNMVTADGVAEGVASVVSDAIDWAPADWRANVDDVLAIARVGRRLLADPRAPQDGFRALQSYVADGLSAYRHYLAIQ